MKSILPALIVSMVLAAAAAAFVLADVPASQPAALTVPEAIAIAAVDPNRLLGKTVEARALIVARDWPSADVREFRFQAYDLIADSNRDRPRNHAPPRKVGEVYWSINWAFSGDKQMADQFRVGEKYLIRGTVAKCVTGREGKTRGMKVHLRDVKAVEKL